MNSQGEAARAALWRAGVRAWRTAKRLDLVARAEPTVWRLARAIGGKPVGSETTVELRHGITLISPSAYRDVRTLRAAMYEPDVTRLFEKTLRPGMTILDVGAYIGYYSVLASRLVGPEGRV